MFDNCYGISELNDLMTSFNFFVNDHLEPVFFDVKDCRRFINKVLKVRNPEYVYRAVKSFDSEGYQIVVIYVAKPYKIFVERGYQNEKRS